jgi:hypothetical protein
MSAFERSQPIMSDDANINEPKQPDAKTSGQQTSMTYYEDTKTFWREFDQKKCKT